MNYKSKIENLNIYNDVLLSMAEIEAEIKEILYINTSQEWSIKNKLTYNDRSKIVKIDYYLISQNVPNVIRHTFKIGKIKYIIKERNIESTKEYQIKFPTKLQKELYFDIENWFNRLLTKNIIIPLGTKEIKVKNHKEAYMYLYNDYQIADNYLSTTKSFFNYPKEFDFITESIIHLAEKKKDEIQKRLTK